MKKITPLLVLMLHGWLNQASAIVVTVGTESTCDYDLSQTDTLQDAIDDTGVTEIRVSKTTVADPVTIDRPLILSGGYDDCAAAALGQLSQDALPNATIDAGGTGRPVTLLSNSPGVVAINYFDLKNGNPGTAGPTNSGGGLYASADNQADLFLDHSRLFQNTAFAGAGLYFDGTTHQTKLTVKDGLVSFNQAINSTNSGFNGGGGIFFTGGELLVHGETAISNNSITSNAGFAVGGGLFASNAVVNLIGGSSNSTNGMRSNTAGFRGGAIYLGGGVTLNITGHPTMIDGSMLGEPNAAFYIADNSVTNEGGGGIFSVQSTVNLRHVDMRQNTGGQLGGAIALLESTLTVDAQNQKDCQYYPHGCNIISTNQADFGGAIWANVDSNITVRKTQFSQNAANQGTTLNVGSSLATFESVVIVLDGLFQLGYDNHNVITSSNANVTLKYTSITLNRTNTSVFNSLGTGNNPGIHVYNSVVYNPMAPNLGTVADQATNNYDCVLSNSAEATVVITSQEFDDMFNNPNALDLRLKPNSLAIDYCPGSGSATPATADFNGIVRGYDDPATLNVLGVYDAGAHEFDDDLIFADRFDLF
jgi:hypothetical protein